MKRIDPLLRIAQAEMDILKQYMKARRIDVEYSENGYPKEWTLRQNKKGYRTPDSFDKIVFERMQSLFNEWNDAKNEPSSKNIEKLMCCVFEPRLEKDKYDLTLIGSRVCKIALQKTIEIEDESGKFVYDYEAEYYPGKRSDE